MKLSKTMKCPTITLTMPDKPESQFEAARLNNAPKEDVASLESEFSRLEQKAMESDQPENAARRTPEQLAERYAWSSRMIAIRKHLATIFAEEREWIECGSCAGRGCKFCSRGMVFIPVAH